ncbi:MAG TPA: type II toxin-antitoxin system VapB family antitoxin [Jatrophihabitans sp.]|nr:type II toxin-antitoxin system VapB family antitoxin [Jatrophihabitans sp.]
MAKRTTVTIDEELLAKARAILGITEVSTVVNAGLREIIRADAARRLIALGGSMPEAEATPRRRPA